MVVRKIAVLGASGVAGRSFVPLAKEAGFDVLTNRVDVFDLAGLLAQFKGCDAVINLASAVPKNHSRETHVDAWRMNDLIRRQGVKNICTAGQLTGVRLLVQQSIAMLDCGGPYDSAKEMETFLHSSPIETRIVRGALFYGQGTGLEELLRLELLRYTSNLDRPVVDCQENWISVVHVNDFAHAVFAVLTNGAANQVYTACDDQPLQWKNVYPLAANYFGWQSEPVSGGHHWPDFRVTNSQLKEIGWYPKNQFLTRNGIRQHP
jgi:nucleoside-diphosphate-sugar epimerase